MTENTNIMIVEDESIEAMSIQNRLEKLGYSISIIVSSGWKAIQETKRTKPDAILMNIKLKGEMDGIEAAARITEIIDIPIIFITAYADKPTLARARDIGPFGYLIKPIDTTELQATIEMAIYKHKMESMLKESEERFRAFADYTYDWEYWIAPDGSLIYISPSCERISRYKTTEFLEDPALLEKIVHLEDRQLFSRHLREGSEKDMPLSIEFRITTKGGEIRWIGHVCQLVRNGKGYNLGRRVSNRDITERKKAEELREKLIIDLQDAANKIKTLSGYLPICSSCKKIRNENGCWSELEVFISNHSDAEFSHSLCEDCAKKLYPDFHKDSNKDDD